MKINFDKIFLGILWLLTATLATTFWMNTRYGFNIFSSAHWAYLSQLQSQRTDIKTGFYISLIFAILVSVVVLYFLIRPHFRKIPMPMSAEADSNFVKTSSDTTKGKGHLQNSTQQKSQSNANVPSVTSPETTPSSLFGLNRPVSPMSGVVTKNLTTYKTAPITDPGKTSDQQNKETTKKISEIFDKAKYIVKKCSNIGDITSPAFAVGYNQSVWLGLVHKSPEQGQNVADTLITFFTDTLGETAQEIDVHICIVEPTNENTPISDNIHLFSTLDELDDFMANNKNEKPEDFEPDLFEAFSSYIDTVTNYIGKH